MKTNDVMVFDLDDTLYYEIDYLKSSFKEIAHILDPYSTVSLFEKMFELWTSKQDVFDYLLREYSGASLTKENLLSYYRNHKPNISIDEESMNFFYYLKKNDIPICLITDGREVTQLNKIKALKLTNFINPSDIYISEITQHPKPDPYSYERIMISYPNCRYHYVGDNTIKDFVAPNSLGWQSYCLKDKGWNIHQQSYNLSAELLPTFWIESLNEIQKLIDNTIIS